MPRAPTFRAMASWALAIRGRVPRAWGYALGAMPIVALLGVWALLTAGETHERIVTPSILPSPWEVFGAVPALLDRSGDQSVHHHVLASLRRVAISFGIALAVALPLGVGMGAFGLFRAAFTPLTTASSYIPISTLVPLTMSWFGTNELQKVLFLAMAFAICLLPLVVKAIDSVPDVYLRTAWTLGATRRQVVFRVLVPVAAPDLWHAMRLAFGVGWTYIVLTEALVLTDGIGVLIEQGRRRGPREQIYLAIIIITVIAWIVDLGWERAGRLLFPYRKPR